MKVFLMHRDRDVDLEQERPVNEEVLVPDLDLEALFAAMALDDAFLYEAAKRTLLCGTTDVDTIAYRQQVLQDCLRRPGSVRALYEIAVNAITADRKNWGAYLTRPEAILDRSLRVLDDFLKALRGLRTIADQNAEVCRSEGFSRFLSMLQTELDDEYLRAVESRWRELRFRHGVLMSAELGRGNQGTRYVLRRPGRQTRTRRVITRSRDRYTFTIPTRDDRGLEALADLRGRGLVLVAGALARSIDHMLHFFRMLRAELAFYIGCLNLHEKLIAGGNVVCFPEPTASGRRELSGTGLYDVSVALHLSSQPVGNELDANGTDLVMITGANRGGKSTFLRSLGLAQLMMQSGMFVGARSFSAEVCHGVFTHFKREEDASMQSGKLDEELGRMSSIADSITPGCLLLCNESFAATNEREGSEIARQVIRGLRQAGVRVVFVTHLFDLAHSLWSQRGDTDLFLRAERLEDGTRTFRLPQGEPQATSYGADIYRRIFGVSLPGQLP